MKQILDYHDPLIEKRGIRKATGFSDQGQIERFSAINSQIGKPSPERILDYGCNVGDFIDYKGLGSGQYIGIDLDIRFIREARRRFPTYKFICGNMADDEFFKTIQDIKIQCVVASGVFCYDLGPSTLKIYRKVVNRLWRLTTDSLIFNVLRKSGNHENVTFDSQDIFELFPQDCERWNIIADYRDNDATIVLRK